MTGTPCEANGVVGVCINAGLDDRGCHADNPCEGVVCEGDLLCVNNDTSRLLYYCDYADGGVCKQKAEGCLDYDECTYDRCDPETGDCFCPVVPDGESCCLRWEERCDFCITAHCCYWVCVDPGSCNSGVCE